MPKDTIRISEMEENQNISQNDIIEVSTFDQQQGSYTTKQLSIARLANWVNRFLGNLITKFSSEHLTLTEAVNRLFELTPTLRSLQDVSINDATLEPRVPSERFNSALVYNQEMGKWTNEPYPFIEYEGIIRGRNKSPIITTDPSTGLPVDEHIIIPAGVNVWSETHVFVNIIYYGNYPVSLDFVDVPEAQGDPKPKKVNITFKQSPYEMTGDENSYMTYTLRIWT